MSLMIYWSKLAATPGTTSKTSQKNPPSSHAANQYIETVILIFIFNKKSKLKEKKITIYIYIYMIRDHYEFETYRLKMYSTRRDFRKYCVRVHCVLHPAARQTLRYCACVHCVLHPAALSNATILCVCVHCVLHPAALSNATIFFYFFIYTLFQ